MDSTAPLTLFAVKMLLLLCGGCRAIRVERKKRVGEREATVLPRDWGSSSLTGPHREERTIGASGEDSRGSKLPKKFTLYASGLPYQVND